MRHNALQLRETIRREHPHEHPDRILRDRIENLQVGLREARGRQTRAGSEILELEGSIRRLQSAIDPRAAPVHKGWLIAIGLIGFALAAPYLWSCIPTVMIALIYALPLIVIGAGLTLLGWLLSLVVKAAAS